MVAGECTEKERSPKCDHKGLRIDEHESGDNYKSVNHNTSHSSSDESLKSKSDIETATGGRSTDSCCSSNNSTADKEIEEISYPEKDCLNSTYLCDEKIGSVVERTENSKTDCNFTSWSTRRLSKYRNLYSLTDKLDLATWSPNFRHMKMDSIVLEESKIEDCDKDCLLMKMRNYLADYQESRGAVSREEYTFSTLVKVMGQATGRCLVALFYVIVNIAPVFEIFLHILRFIFDTMIDIKTTKDAQQFVFKTSIFFVQLMCIYVCLIFIFGFIISPIVRMTFGIMAKILLYD